MIIEDPAAGAELVAGAIVKLAADRAQPVLGLSTGGSPRPVYDRLADLSAAGSLSLAGARAFLLDEYVGLPAGHPAAYRQVIERELVARTELTSERVLGPDVWVPAPDLPAACSLYETRIAEAGGIDLQLLGVGTDGHIAFNEPGSSLTSRTRIKTLTARTRADNARFFHGDPGAVPLHVVTQGIATILEARHLVLLAWGEAKAKVVAQLVEGPLTASVPASALQLHGHATVVVDGPAASRLQRADSYRETWAGKPCWQGI